MGINDFINTNVKYLKRVFLNTFFSKCLDAIRLNFIFIFDHCLKQFNSMDYKIHTQNLGIPRA